jgi:hypothetical protein
MERVKIDLGSTVLGAVLCILAPLMLALGGSLLTSGILFFSGLALLFNPHESTSSRITHSALFGVAVLLLVVNLVTTLSV